MRPILMLLAGGTLVAAACVVGPRLDTFGPAQSPNGITIELIVGGRRMQGELVDVRDTAYVVFHAGRVTLVPFHLVRSAAAPFRTVEWQPSGATPPPAIRARLRLLSRFPQGLSPELERRLLDALGQASIEVVS